MAQVRRGLAPKGVQIVQPLHRAYKYEYLLLAVLPTEAQLEGSWMPRMKREHLNPLLESWSFDLTIWVQGGKSASTAQMGTDRIFHLERGRRVAGLRAS